MTASPALAEEATSDPYAGYTDSDKTRQADTQRDYRNHPWIGDYQSYQQRARGSNHTRYRNDGVIVSGGVRYPTGAIDDAGFSLRFYSGTTHRGITTRGVYRHDPYYRYNRHRDYYAPYRYKYNRYDYPRYRTYRYDDGFKYKYQYRHPYFYGSPERYWHHYDRFDNPYRDPHYKYRPHRRYDYFYDDSFKHRRSPWHKHRFKHRR
jgi:hypothetical protein